MRSTVHVDNKNKNKNILIIGEAPTYALDNNALTVDTAEYPVNFTQSGKKIVLSLNYNRSNSFLYVNAVKMYPFKAK